MYMIHIHVKANNERTHVAQSFGSRTNSLTLSLTENIL